jgi:hypothetical protein
MRTRARDLLVPVAVAAVGALVLALLGMQTMAFTDYEIEAEPSLLALRHADLTGFFHHLPAYGGSLVLRAPFALLPGAWHGGDLALFRSMAAPCLLAAVTLGVVLHARARALAAGPVAAWLALALVAVNPITLRALEIGHPEELLGGALCAGAALAAIGRRPLLAGVLLGLALANKPWAVLAVIPVLALVPERRRLALAAAVVVAGAVLAPVLLFSPAATTSASAVAQTSATIFQPWQLWWFLGEHGHRVMGTFGEHVGYRTSPAWVARASHPLVVLVPIAFALVVVLRQRMLTAVQGLALLALCLHLRCLLDSWNISYYALPAFLALATWEVQSRRAPVVTLAATVACWTSFEVVPKIASPDVQAAAYLAWSVPLAAGLALALVSPTAWSRVSARMGESVRRQLPTLAAPAARR